jgi:broad specificity phosphatase PhoE
MKLYFLRHELRPLNDSTFLTELFKIGKENSASKLKDLLNTLNIDKIYSSPFIRVLQTVRPFAKENNLQTFCDYSLAETITEKTFIHKPEMTLTEEHIKEFDINLDYMSLFDKSLLVYPENDWQIYERVNNFCNYLVYTYGSSNMTILVAGHMDIVNLCLSYFSKQNIDRHAYYAMGKLSCVKNRKVIFLNEGSELDDEVELSSL